MAPLVELPVAFSVRVQQWFRRLQYGRRSNAEVFPLHSPRGYASTVGLPQGPHQSAGVSARLEKSSRAAHRTSHGVDSR